MFNNKKVEFWFWATLAAINLFTLALIYDYDNEFNIVLNSCVLVLCFAKALVCAIEIDREK